MNKILISAVCVMALFCLFAPSSFAQTDWTNDAAGGVVRATINDFTFDSSPNVSIVVCTSDFAYAIMTTNILTDDATGYNYATVESATGYAQEPKADGEQGTNLSTLGSTDMPSGEWTWVGGQASS